MRDVRLHFGWSYILGLGFLRLLDYAYNRWCQNTIAALDFKSMSNNTIPDPSELENKPLVEAVFELRWKLKQRPSMPPMDPGYSLFQGRFYDRVRRDYPAAIALPPAEVPEALTPQVVRMQFRTKEKGWPLVQTGPGVLTVNETADYSWETFLPRLEQAITCAFDSYPSEVAPFTPEQSMLRYINAIAYDPHKSDTPVLKFLQQQLHMTVVPEALLFDDPDVLHSPSGLHLNLAYTVDKAIAGIAFTLGSAQDKPSIIMEISVRSIPNETPQDPNALRQWVIAAHGIVEKWFFALVRGQLLDQFGKK